MKSKTVETQALAADMVCGSVKELGAVVLFVAQTYTVGAFVTAEANEDVEKAYETVRVTVMELYIYAVGLRRTE